MTYNDPYTDDELNYWGNTPEEQKAYDQQRDIESKQEILDLDALGLWAENWEAEIAEDYSLSGTEFVEANCNIDEHPRAMAFGQFLGWTSDPEVAQELAFGDRKVLDDISDADTRQVATNIFDRLEEMNYWGQSDE